jgi:hypothetical protein
MMAHHAISAPDDLSIMQAIRWGQVRACGGSERVARAIVSTMLRDTIADEPFWLTVMQFFAANPMLDWRQIGPTVDWIYNQRFVPAPQIPPVIPQPNLCMKGRSVESVLREVERWHRQLNRAVIPGAISWPTCRIAGLEMIDESEPLPLVVRIDEIVTSSGLLEEGRAMSHCVASYARSCARGASAIFSMRINRAGGFERCLTIEVDPRARQIVQARGKCNVLPSPSQQRYLALWAADVELAICRF